MKRLFAIFLAVSLCFGGFFLTASAEPNDNWMDIDGNSNAEEDVAASGTLGGIVWKLSIYGNLTISGEGIMADFSEDFTEAWFAYKNDIFTVTVEEGVDSLGAFAFNGLKNVIKITIPASVTAIGNGAFGGCKSLNTVSVSGNNPNYCSVDGVLYNKSKDMLVCCPGTLAGSVYNVDKGVKKIGPYAFYDCSSLTGVILPDGLAEIGQGAFGSCGNLVSVTVPSTVTVIGDGAFEKCILLKSITIPNGLTTLGDNAFWGCVALDSVKMPEGITSIGQSTFEKCKSITSITVPEGVENIGKSAFADCESLETVNLPDSLETVGYNAFKGCTAIKEVTFAGTEWGFNRLDVEAGNDFLLTAELYTSPSPVPWIIGALFLLGFAAVLFLAVKRERYGDKKMPVPSKNKQES